jgi:hypothetical protein
MTEPLDQAQTAAVTLEAKSGGPTPDPNAVVPLPEEGPRSLAYFQQQVKAGTDKRAQYIPEWQINVDRYLGKYLANEPTVDTITVPLDFAFVEQKRALLFYQLPEIQLRPTREEFAQATPLFQAVVNHYLGPEGVNAAVGFGEALFDALCPAGVMAVKIGYQNYAPLQPMTDPMTGQPAIDPATGQPVMAPVPVWEQYFLSRLSPSSLILPAGWTGSNYDRSPWIAHNFDLDAAVAERTYDIEPSTLMTSSAKQDTSLNQQEAGRSDTTASSRVKGIELWYLASTFDPSAHPEAVWQLVWLEGMETPLVHRPSPYQRPGPNGGYLGMCGYPIHVSALRYVSDSAYPPSDCQVSRPQIDELSRSRTQMIQQRARAIPLRWVDKGRATPDEVNKIVTGEVQGVVPVDGNGNEIIGQVAMAQWPRENFAFNDIVMRDAEREWGMDADMQTGAGGDGTKTATEISVTQQASNVRMAAERAKVLTWIVGAAKKLAALVQLFADEPDYVAILGQDGSQRLQSWDKTQIAGEFVFFARPDAALKQDAQADRKQSVDLYQFLANDPNVNRQALLTSVLLRHNLDPATILTQPPPPKPEQPKIALSFKGEDLNPFAPQYANVYAILTAVGAPGLSPPAPAVNPAHGGAVAPVEPLSKHAVQQSGQLPGGGQAAAVGSVQ